MKGPVLATHSPTNVWSVISRIKTFLPTYELDENGSMESKMKDSEDPVSRKTLTGTLISL